jgi:dTDP-4-dehydrorhamnose reductase
MKILIFGASGMLGNTVLRYLFNSNAYDVKGTVRSDTALKLLPKHMHNNVISGVDAENSDEIAELFHDIRPDIVINCIGLIKQINKSKDVLSTIPVNTLFPHRLATLSGLVNARLIHFSTDCVFEGIKGMYKESDVPDAQDLYGKSKLIGEVDYPYAITLRTSIIGHELTGHRSLVGWFLSQEGTTKGYRKAIFSGLPSVEIARIIKEYVLPHPEIHGIYHLSADSINKYDLLKIVADIYGKKIDIEPDDNLVIDRSLDSTCFRNATGFVPESWPEMIRRMHEFG